MAELQVACEFAGLQMVSEYTPLLALTTESTNGLRVLEMSS